VSLRARLLVGMALVALVLGVAAVVIARTTEDHLVDQVDAQLRNAGPLGRLFDRDGRGPGPALGGEDADGLSSLYVALVDRHGTFFTRLTPNLSADPPPPPAINAKDAYDSAATGTPFTVGSEPSGLRYRVLGRTDNRLGAVVVLALPLSDVDDAVDRLIAVEVVATLLVVAVLALVTYWVIRLGVRPVKQMAATAANIAGGDLSHRVPDVAPGTEAGELGVALNQMLGRIEEAFDERTRSEGRLRQFVADASHELRTPVTTIRGYAELYRAGGLTDVDERDEAMRRTEEEAVRMAALIEDLLLLARLDEGRPLRQEPVDLDVLVRDAVLDARAVAPDRPISASTDGPVTVLGDEPRLRQVIGNLVGNALVHTAADTPIDVRLRRTDNQAVLEVADRGGGMDDEAAARAFERFYRADPSRSRHSGGSGLGLSIVHATVAAHGGTVSLDSAPGRGTTVRVELPAG